MSKKGIIGLGLLLMAIVVLWRGIDHSNIAKKDQADLVMLDGNTVQMADLRGKVVVLNNWAGWCPPCVAEMPSIHELKKKTADKNVAFVMVSFDDNPSRAVSFIQQHKFDFDVYFPGASYPHATSSIPATFILNKQGAVVWSHEGMYHYNTEEILTLIDSLDQ